MEETRRSEKPALRLERRYSAAPEKVWRAWTDPQALTQWWGPGAGNSVSVAELDVRVGGRFRIVFGGTEGKDNECAGDYKEVVPNRRLVFTWCWPRTTPERVSLVTIELKRVDGGTEVDFRHEQFFNEQARDGHKRGWTAAFDQLEVYLALETSA